MGDDFIAFLLVPRDFRHLFYSYIPLIIFLILKAVTFTQEGRQLRDDPFRNFQTRHR